MPGSRPLRGSLALRSAADSPRSCLLGRMVSIKVNEGSSETVDLNVDILQPSIESAHNEIGRQSGSKRKPRYIQMKHALPMTKQ